MSSPRVAQQGFCPECGGYGRRCIDSEDSDSCHWWMKFRCGCGVTYKEHYKYDHSEIVKEDVTP